MPTAHTLVALLGLIVAAVGIFMSTWSAVFGSGDPYGSGFAVALAGTMIVFISK